MTSDDYLNDITTAAADKQRLSDEFCQKHSKRLADIQGKVNRNIYHALKLIEPRYTSEKKFSLDCLQLIDRAIKINSTCLDLIRQINFVEAAILSRSIIEFCTTSIAIHKDTKTFDKFTSNKKFNSTSTIQTARKYIPEIGKIWGDISNYIIHVNPTMHGTKKHLDDYGEHVMTEFHFTCLENNIPEDTDAMFDHIELMTYLILFTIEIVCLYKIKYKDIDGYAYPDKKTLLMGDSGEVSFKRLYKKIYKIQ